MIGVATIYSKSRLKMMLISTLLTIRKFISKEFVKKFIGIEAILAFMICLSGINAIPYTDISTIEIINIRRTIYLVILIMLSIGCLLTRNTNDKLFGLTCFFYGLIVTINFLFHRENLSTYMYILSSIFFIYLFVNYLTGREFNWNKFLIYFFVGILIVDILILAVFIMGIFDTKIIKLLISGFGGNRVNFSIWLFQIFFVNFYLLYLVKNIRARYFFTVVLSIIFLIQGVTGGRIGFFASLIAFIYFSWILNHHFLKRLYWISYLALLFIASVYFVPNFIQNPEIYNHNVPNLILRDFLPNKNNIGLFEYMDTLLSHRLEIFINGLGLIDANIFLFGMGAGNFSVIADGSTWSVHNIFLKVLGEFGIFGLTSYCIIYSLPFFKIKGDDKIIKPIIFLMVLSFIIALFQPEFIFTGLSDCLIIWLGYSIVMNGGTCNYVENYFFKKYFYI